MTRGGLRAGIVVAALAACAPGRRAGEERGGARPDFALVRGGKPQATVLLGQDAGDVERTAADKFTAAVRRDSGAVLRLAAADPGKGDLVVIGTAGTHPELARLASTFNLPLKDLAPQGFLLRTLADGDRNILVIAGGDPRGAFYGVREALDQVVTCTRGKDVVVAPCDVRRAPALDARGTYCLTCWSTAPTYERSAWEASFDSMADAGMNRVMFWMDGLFRSKRHPEAFLDKEGGHYQGAKLTDGDIRALIRYAHDRGMEFFFGSGVFGWFVAGDFAKRVPEAADKPKGGNLCPSSPVAQAFTLEYLSEMIETFPEADGYMLEIRDELHDCACATCQKPLDDRGSKQFGQSELDFLEKLRTTVWERHPKTKFIWLMGYANHNEDVLYYERMREMGKDPRMEWLEVRNSWTLPAAGGGRKPLPYFSDRVYHWDQYYKFNGEVLRGVIRKTAAEGLKGFLPAYEPGFATISIYNSRDYVPFPVHLIPYCLTQFFYREYTWDPQLDDRTLVERAHRKFFGAEVPREMVDDLFFLKRFMHAHYQELCREIGDGLQPNATLLALVDDIWTTPRKADKQWLLEETLKTIRSFRSLVRGEGDMARLARIEKKIAALRPKATPRSDDTFDLMMQAIDDIRKELGKCDGYAKEADEAIARIDAHLAELNKAKGDKPGGEKK